MSAVHSALARRFPSPEWATFFEVRNDAGFKAHRSADCVAMNTWPSRRLAIHGVEVKAVRSDWLRELKDPSKSAPIQRYCDRWWLAVADDTVAKVEEIPEAWGLLVLRGKSLVAVKEAPALEPEPLNRGFVAALLRRATENVVPKSAVDEMVRERVEENEKRRQHWQKTDAEHEIESLKRRLKDLSDRVSTFEAESGIDLSKREYGKIGDPKYVGACVRAILSGDADLSTQRFEHLRETFAREIERLDRAIAAFGGASKQGAEVV